MGYEQLIDLGSKLGQGIGLAFGNYDAMQQRDRLQKIEDDKRKRDDAEYRANKNLELAKVAFNMGNIELAKTYHAAYAKDLAESAGQPAPNFLMPTKEVTRTAGPLESAFRAQGDPQPFYQSSAPAAPFGEKFAPPQTGFGMPAEKAFPMGGDFQATPKPRMVTEQVPDRDAFGRVLGIAPKTDLHSVGGKALVQSSQDPVTGDYSFKTVWEAPATPQKLIKVQSKEFGVGFYNPATGTTDWEKDGFGMTVGNGQDVINPQGDVVYSNKDEIGQQRVDNQKTQNEARNVIAQAKLEIDRMKAAAYVKSKNGGNLEKELIKVRSKWFEKKADFVSKGIASFRNTNKKGIYDPTTGRVRPLDQLTDINQETFRLERLWDSMYPYSEIESPPQQSFNQAPPSKATGGAVALTAQFQKVKEYVKNKYGLNPTSEGRTTAEQAAAYKTYGPSGAAKPGTSSHEKGEGLDFAGDRKTLEAIASDMKARGLYVRFEPNGSLHVGTDHGAKLTNSNGVAAADKWARKFQ